jgi:ABC-2 type transport system ATP-binding protein
MSATQTATSPAAIRATGLTKRYGDLLAVDGLTLEIGGGEFFGLLGPNGSGKTTTVHMLATLIQPNAGSAEVAGFDIGRNAIKARESIGIVFQESALDRTLTVTENLRFAGLLQNLTPKTISERSSELLELFGLNGHRPWSSASTQGAFSRRAHHRARYSEQAPDMAFHRKTANPQRDDRSADDALSRGSRQLRPRILHS